MNSASRVSRSRRDGKTTGARWRRNARTRRTTPRSRWSPRERCFRPFASRTTPSRPSWNARWRWGAWDTARSSSRRRSRERRRRREGAATNVSAEDLRVAEALAIAPRATIDPVSIASSTTTTRTPQSPSSPPPPPRDDVSSSEEEDVSSSEPDENGKEPEDDASDEPESEPPSDALVFAPDDASGALDPSLALAFERAARRKVGRAGRARVKTSSFRSIGRHVKAIFPAGGVVRKIAADAGRCRAAARNRSRGDDARAHPRHRDACTSPRTTFETNGNVAPRRELDRVPRGRVRKHGAPSYGGGEIRRRYDCVAESHTKRDSVALVSIAGDAATVLLPPTRSILAANRRLAELPPWGRRASRTVLPPPGELSTPKTKGGASDARVVLITDGGANVGLDRSLQTSSERCPPEAYVPSKAALREEAVDAAVGAWDARGFGFGGGHGESARAGGERMDAARSNLAKDVARGGREVSQDADGRGPARERRGALVVSARVERARSLFSPLTDCRTPPEPVSRRFTPRVPADARARVGSPSRDPRRNGAF